MNKTKYEITYSGQFKKDIKLAKKQNKDLSKLKYVINKLANGETLEYKYNDHLLIGEYVGFRECHIEPDWLLIYKIKKEALVLITHRIGSHSDLFKK